MLKFGLYQGCLSFSTQRRTFFLFLPFPLTSGEEIPRYAPSDKNSMGQLSEGIKLFEFLRYHSVCGDVNSLFLGCRNPVEK